MPDVGRAKLGVGPAHRTSNIEHRTSNANALGRGETCPRAGADDFVTGPLSSLKSPELVIAIILTLPIVAGVRMKWKFFGLALIATVALLSAGCSGINATGSVSPVSFFLPGLGAVQPAPIPSLDPSTNSTSVQAKSVEIVAKAN